MLQQGHTPKQIANQLDIQEWLVAVIATIS